MHAVKTDIFGAALCMVPFELFALTIGEFEQKYDANMVLQQNTTMYSK